MRQDVVSIEVAAVNRIKQKLKEQRDAQEQTPGGDNSSVYELLVLFLAKLPSNTERNKFYLYTGFMLTLQYMKSNGCDPDYEVMLQSFNRFWDQKAVEICNSLDADGSLDADDQDRALSLSTREFTFKIKEQAEHILEKFWAQTDLRPTVTDIMIATMYPDAKYILKKLLSHNKKDSDYIKKYLSTYDERFEHCLSGSGSLLHESHVIAIRLACCDTLEQLLAEVEAKTVIPKVEVYFRDYINKHGRKGPCLDGNLVHFANHVEDLARKSEHLQLQAEVPLKDELAREDFTNIPDSWSEYRELSNFLKRHSTLTLKKGEFPAMELQKIILLKLKNIFNEARHQNITSLETASKLKTLFYMLNITVKTSDEMNLDDVLAWKWAEPRSEDAVFPELVANTEPGLNDIATVLTAISLSRYSYSFFDPNNPIIKALNESTKQVIWDPFFKQLSATVTQLQKNIRGKAARRIVNSLQEERRHQQHSEYLDQARKELVGLYCHESSEKEVADSLNSNLTNKMDEIYSEDFFKGLEIELSYRPIQCQKLCAVFQKNEKMKELEPCKMFLERNSLQVEEKKWNDARKILQADGDVLRLGGSKFLIKMDNDIYSFAMSLCTTQFNNSDFLAQDRLGHNFVLNRLAKPHKESETALLGKSVNVYAECKELDLYMELVNYVAPHIKVRDQLVRLAAEGKEEAKKLHKYSEEHCRGLFKQLLYVINIPHPINSDSLAMLAKKVYANLVFALSLVLSSMELDLRGPSGDHLVKLCTLAREIYNYNNKIRGHALPRSFFAFLAAYGPVHLREEESRALEVRFPITNRYKQEGTTACTRLLFFFHRKIGREVAKLKKEKWEAKLIDGSCGGFAWTVDMEKQRLPWCFDGCSVTDLKPSDEAQSESEDEDEEPREFYSETLELDPDGEVVEYASAALPPPPPPSLKRSFARVWK